MSHYTIEKCLTMAWIVGAHPDMRHNKWQLSIFVALAIGNWITIYLIISLLFYKEDTITIGDFAETFSGMSLVIHVLVIFFGVNMAVICLDTLIMTLIVLTHIQFRLLNHEVENLYSYGLGQGNRKYFVNKLKKIVRHHNFLLEFTQKINMTFSETFLTYMGIIIIAICIEMYNLSTGPRKHSVEPTSVNGTRIWKTHSLPKILSCKASRECL
ncbi:unnamed protein product [Acanthoscelides obtectus]|uniref:Uncharacterized protein n=1 Tax=Acanthoscelides obtectus TaxID=200917 RepID=A0A9P0MEN5_ACAOB|nr:unnamed protein product [Acanthoscelides obtectus]CAK1622358.1 hypothetical protein AOBTE_LOCUS1443 [Acanthoscelides obtectus]